MAFKATGMTTSEAFTQLRQRAAGLKNTLQSHRTMMTAATCDAVIPLETIRLLGLTVAIMSQISSTPGLAAYARSQVDDPNYDIVAEYNTLVNAINTAKNTLTSMFPKEAGSGYLLYQTLTAEGVVQNRTFTAAQLANAIIQLDAVIAAIS